MPKTDNELPSLDILLILKADPIVMKSKAEHWDPRLENP
jgi:hypothetical protein